MPRSAHSPVYTSHALSSHTWTLNSLCFNSTEEQQERHYFMLTPAKLPFAFQILIIRPLYPATPNYRLSACFPPRFP